METMVGASVLVIVIAAAFSLMVSVLRTQQRMQIKAQLEEDLERSVENIRRDMRLTSTGIGLMAWYPAGGAAYTAVSLPLGGDEDNDGEMDRDSEGRIKWYSTVIYHIAPGSPDKLRRTVFSPRNNSVTPNDYYRQLEGVVKSTDPSQYQMYEHAGETVSSRVVFANLVNLSFRPPHSTFDGYAPVPGHKRFNFGAVLLGDGDRYLQLHVEGRNSKSIDYNVIIDRIYASSSGTPREAELYAPVYKHPSYPYFYAAFDKGSVTGLRGSLWSGNAALKYEPKKVPASLSFHLYNDLWCDTSFDTPPAEEATGVRVDLDQGAAASFPYIFDYVVTMDKGIAWSSSSAGSVSTTRTYTASTSVRVPLYGTSARQPYSIVRNGRWVRLYFERATNAPLGIANVQIHNPSNGVSSAVTFDSGSSSVLLSTNSSLVVASDWVEQWEIDRQQDYEVTFDIVGSPGTPSGAFTWYSGSTGEVLSAVNGVASRDIPALSAVETGYPDTGIFRSRPFDTQMDNPEYRYMTWTHDEFFAQGGDIDIRIRAGDNPDMSDADWTDANAGNDGYFQSNNRNDISKLPAGRFVQYEALFSCGQGGAVPEAHIDTTAILRDVTIEWKGPRTLTDVVVEFGTGPDCGIVSATVDGVKLVRALEVDIEIYRDSTTKRETAAGRIEVRPRNSGL